MFNLHLLASGLGDILIIIAYIVFFLCYFAMIIQGQRDQSYGASLITICTQVGIGFICGFVGPWVEPELFPFADDTLLIWIWRLQWLLWMVIFVQYLVYAPKAPKRFPELVPYFYLIAFGSLLVWPITEWLFVLFTRDYYINFTWPLATLLMGLGNFVMLFTRVQLRGLSVLVAWGFFIATVLLYLATMLGGMEVSYPSHASKCMDPAAACVGTPPEGCPAICYEASGYAFMYWVYALGSVWLLAYAAMLTSRRQELSPDWDITKTEARYGMAE